MNERTDVLQGTLALMILKTLQTLGPQHGYGIARRIEQVSDGALQLNQGTLYPALVKLEQQRWIRARWGTSDNNRKAKFYSLTPRGARQLAAEESKWSRVASLVGRFLVEPSGDAGWTRFEDCGRGCPSGGGPVRSRPICRRSCRATWTT